MQLHRQGYLCFGWTRSSNWLAAAMELHVVQPGVANLHVFAASIKNCVLEIGICA